MGGEPVERINFEKVYPLRKGLQANPCHEMLVGELGSPLSKHCKVKSSIWTIAKFRCNFSGFVNTLAASLEQITLQMVA